MKLSDTATKKFHDFALFSELFKGRFSWYFCYIKSERIAHTLSYLGQHTPGDVYLWKEVLTKANKVTDTILLFCVGTVPLSEVLGSIFSLMSAVRFSTLEGLMSEANGALIISECELLAERLGSESTLLSLSTEQLSVPLLLQQEQQDVDGKTLAAQSTSPLAHKGQDKRHLSADRPMAKGQEDRSAKILNFIRSRNGVSIKEISNIVRNCSEKTIQRELVSLIKRGSIKKVGERRWSVYLPSAI